MNILIKPDFVSSSLSGIENAFSLLTLNDFSEFSASINEENCFIHFDDDEQKNVEALIEIILREQEKSGQGQALILHSALNILLTMIFMKMALPIADKFKIDKACHLLLDTDLKIEEIISQSDYSDRTQFFKKFVEQIGITPMQYRSKIKKN